MIMFVISGPFRHEVFSSWQERRNIVMNRMMDCSAEESAANIMVEQERVHECEDPPPCLPLPWAGLNGNIPAANPRKCAIVICVSCPHTPVLVPADP